MSRIIEQQPLTLCGLALGVIIDFVTALLPVVVLRNLQMDQKRKAAVGVVLGLGLLTAACSIGKTVTADLVTKDPTCKCETRECPFFPTP